MGKKLRSKRGSSSKIPLKEFHSSLVKKKLGPNSSNQANDKNQSNIDYMQRKLELEFEHDDFDIEETYYDSPEADNAMVGSSVCQGSSSEQGLGKTTVPKPMGHIETATKGSTPTKNVQDYNEAKGHAQVRMSCVEGLVDVASMDSQTEAEMVQSHCSNGLEASERERERTKKAFLGLGSRSLGVVQCGGVGLKLNRYWHHLQASATHSECRSIFPAIVAGQAFRIKRRHTEEQRIKGARARKKTSDDIFICERVCTSKRMLKKVGSFSKDPIPDTCVTVCGVSELDACSDACARTVYVNQHQVPNWNDICLRRCQSECLKLSASCAF